jgi:hypothetical protein
MSLTSYRAAPPRGTGLCLGRRTLGSPGAPPEQSLPQWSFLGLEFPGACVSL